MGKRPENDVHKNKRSYNQVTTLPSQVPRGLNTYLDDQSSNIPLFFNEKGCSLSLTVYEKDIMENNMEKAIEAGCSHLTHINKGGNETASLTTNINETKKRKRGRPFKKEANNTLMQCYHCNAWVWLLESTEKDSVNKRPLFSICCKQGRILLPTVREPPLLLEKLLSDPDFLRYIRAYNSILAFTSMGADIDYSVQNTYGIYCFKVHGENYHLIGSLLPTEGTPPKFSQMYIYDTANEVKNRLAAMGGGDAEELDQNIVTQLIDMVDEFNVQAKVFRKARDRYESTGHDNFHIHLIGYDKKKKQYELPSSNEIAALVVGDFSSTMGERDIVLQHHSGNLQRIWSTHPLYMTLQYPLLFPYGEIGFYEGLKYKDHKEGKKFVSMREYYTYRIQTRSCESSFIVKSGRLFHQFIVDAYTSLESYRLQWIRSNQTTIRIDLYNNVKDAVNRGDNDPQSVGKRVVLPSSHTGSPRYMAEKYQDAMAMCRCFGNPDLFVTVTANPKWEEITDFVNLTGDKSGVGRPDIESRVFHMKLKQLVTDIEKKNYFGPTNGVVYTIEFQKRGLPHAHILIWLKAEFKNPSTEDIDKFVSAELPDINSDPIGYQLVEQHMMHGPCGIDRPTNSCMERGECSKRYPRDFCSYSSVDKNGYIIYRRRDITCRFILKGDIRLDNRYVVPHNLELVKKYKAHINVEFCNKTSAIKYLFKYITKGVDKATMVLKRKKKTIKGDENVENSRDEVNEIDNYLDCRYVSACEASWRIFKFEIHHQSVPVQRLSIHLPNQQPIILRNNDNLQKALINMEYQDSMFTAWFKMNEYDLEGRDLTYVQFPSKYVWNKSQNIWSKRKIGKFIGRIYNVHPSAGELYYLRMLINYVKGPKSYEDIYTVDGKLHSTFKDACVARGLLENDEEWHESMKEASLWATPNQLRNLFVMLLVHCEVSNPLKLWNSFSKDLSEDIVYLQRKLLKFGNLNLKEKEIESYTLIEIELLLRLYDKSLSDYPNMPVLETTILGRLSNSMIMEESGTGKTFVYNTIINRLRSEGRIVIPVASSGIAALLLPGGRTAHSRFKIPLNAKDDVVCEIKAGSMLANLLIQTDLILWDEAPMTHKYAFEALDKTLRDIMFRTDSDSYTKPFGGKTVLLGGDFRQTLPIIPHGSRQDSVSASINRSYLWNFCQVYTLSKNMRVKQTEIEFSEWLLKVGNGTALKEQDHSSEYSGVDQIIVDKNLIIPAKENGISAIAEHVYKSFDTNYSNIDYLKERAILTPRNDTVDEINKVLLEKLPGHAKMYASADSIINNENTEQDYSLDYPVEYLNTINLPGFPQHKIYLKVNTPIMLIRNICQKKGQCNGTRMVLLRLGHRVIKAKIISGSNTGDEILLPRIVLNQSDGKLPVDIRRKQFPIRICYAMTINKSQGQSLNRVGLYLPRPVFSHGQIKKFRVGLAVISFRYQMSKLLNIEAKLKKQKNSLGDGFWSPDSIGCSSLIVCSQSPRYPNLPMDLKIDIAVKLTNTSLKSVGSILAAGKEGRNIILNSEFRKRVNLSAFIRNSRLVCRNVNFFYDCVEDENPTALYLHGLESLCIWRTAQWMFFY
uniref:ATP-dependent DNA helicase n=1 Tax=Brassica oleracea var. oleracea TaxID=109376 RepID=A0A0D2ZUB6_BRAOL